jgi:hypothetical protein
MSITLFMKASFVFYDYAFAFALTFVVRAAADFFYLV